MEKTFCKKYPDSQVMPDGNGKCSLCEGDCNESRREAFLNSLSPIDRFEREVTDLLIEALNISNGDAQGIVEAHGDIILECFNCATSVKDTAKILVRQSKP